MVTITNYEERKNKEGKLFYVLILQGGLEIIKSASGNSYASIRKASMPTSFDEITCKSLIGTQLSGNIEKVEVAPYEYTNPETREVLILTHRYEFVEEMEMPTVKFTKVVKHSANGHKAEMV